MQIVALSCLITKVITLMQIYHYWALRYERTHQATHWSSLKVNSIKILQNKINISAVIFLSQTSREAAKIPNLFLF